jgi:class 3 adenylate cyclase
MIKLPEDGGALKAFAMIVDINSFTLLVNSFAGSIAQFTRDILAGGITTVEHHGGAVVGLMGDAFYALLPDAESVIECCIGIAIDVNKQCEYFDLLRFQVNDTEYPEGIGMKIGVEYGYLEVADIKTKFMRRQRLFVGKPVIYASRISGARKGNRCLFGPAAAQLIQAAHPLKGPYKIKGKAGEPPYTYYQFDLSDVWLEGCPVKGGRWYVD